MAISRATFAAAATVFSLQFFLSDPKKYWWLSLIIFGGTALIVDEVIYNLTEGNLALIPR